MSNTFAPTEKPKTTLVDNHKKAAQHHQDAAKSHLDDAKHHENGNPEKAAQSTVKAQGFQTLAKKASAKSLKTQAKQA
jgi:hypothetical protein